MPGCRSIRRALGNLSRGVVAAATFLGLSPATAAEGVLVLRNGNVLSGAVTLSGEHYRVDSAGASLQIPLDQVEAACRSLDEAYELRRRDRVGSTADSHVELAQWCLRHDLMNQAAREILDARTIDAGNPSLPGLDLQLRQRLELRASREADLQRAAAEQAAKPAAGELESFQPHTLDPSTEAQEQFVRSIQPMLIHSCATSGCHQPGSRQRLQLDRWALEGNGSPPHIRRNLASVLEQINKDDPPSSPLVQRARQAHGLGRRTSRPLATYQAALLLDWLNQAAGVESATAVEVGPEDAPGREDEPGAEPAVPPGVPAGSASLGAETPHLREFTPRDSFDPEIFNRRFGPKSFETADRQPQTIEPTADFSNATAAPDTPAGFTEPASAD